MFKQYKLALFIFRRDLRIEDNKALNQALISSERVLPIFIFDDRQIGELNAYRSFFALRFMLESLEELSQAFKKHKGTLFFFHDKPEVVVERLITTHHVDALFCNRDYTPFSLRRDEQLEKVCLRYTIPFLTFDDALLNPPEQLLSGNQTPYVVFTPFFKKAQKLSVAEPMKLQGNNFYAKTPAHVLNDHKKFFNELLPDYVARSPLKGGRAAGLDLLNTIPAFENYNSTHDIVALPTTRLSAHNKFGTVSIREVYHAIAHNFSCSHGLIRGLYWRDFFTHVAYGSPFVFGHAFHSKFDSIAWEKNGHLFRAWCRGETGFPLVDAGIRELLTTGFMHNRARMVAASLLVKDFRVDWRLGERFFAQHLIDYDPAVNNGNWQWIASTGAGAQPFFRIFNPWLQQKKFDPKGSYIYRWVPELKTVSAAHLSRLGAEKVKGYPAPLVDHRSESKKTVSWFKKYL